MPTSVHGIRRLPLRRLTSIELWNQLRADPWHTHPASHLEESVASSDAAARNTVIKSHRTTFSLTAFRVSRHYDRFSSLSCCISLGLRRVVTIGQYGGSHMLFMKQSGHPMQGLASELGDGGEDCLSELGKRIW